MKKALCLLLAAAMILALAACGKKNGNNISITGYYELTSITSSSGSKTTDEDIKMLKELGLLATLECFDDGTALLDLFGDKMNLSYDLNKMIFKIEDQEASFEYKDGNIVLVDGGDSLTFVPAQKQ